MARFEGGTVVFETTWTAVKEQIDTRKLDFRFEEDSTAYQIFAVDENFLYTNVIYKSGQAPENQATYDSWRADFEANYKNRVVDFNNTSPVFISNIDGYSVVLKDGATPTANDGYGIALIGYDGANYRMTKMDSSGNQILVGAGTAGTPSGGVISIQGVPGGESIPVSGSVTVSGTVTATNPSVGSTNATTPASATLIGGTDGTNLQASRVFDLDTGGGNQYILGVGLRKAASGGSVEAGTSADPLRIDPTGSTTQPVSGTVAATQSGTWTVQPGNTANTTPWLATISQGGNNAVVKAASTAAVAADPALVVAISPNNSLAIATSDVTGAGTLNALNANASVVLAGRNSVGMFLAAGTLVGTIVPEISMDGGTTWVATFFDDPSTGNKAASIVFGVSNTVTTRTIVGAGGSSNARVRVSAFTSGTATCTLRATTVGDPSHLFTGANGSNPLPPIAGLMAGSDGSTLRNILVDTSGHSMVVGGAAAGAAPVGNPLLIAGQNGSLVQSILTDNIGRLIVAPSFEAASGSISLLGVSYGYIALATNGLNAVRATAYTEQASNAQRSMSSSSGVDTSAGIGARTVRITYYTSTYTGPFTTTVTLNGTTPVNTAATDICFVEKMEVATVGSALFPAGTITLFASTGGGGGAIGTISATDGRTLWAHHYVATGKTCHVTNINASNNSNQGMQFTLKYRPSGSNQFEIQHDWIRPPIGSIGGAFQRHYEPPFKFVGAGRIVAYVRPDQSVSAVYHCSFDYYEE